VIELSFMTLLGACGLGCYIPFMADGDFDADHGFAFDGVGRSAH
jgi:hypothetical protein